MLATSAVQFLVKMINNQPAVTKAWPAITTRAGRTGQGPTCTALNIKAQPQQSAVAYVHQS